jgi:hypothetical protein
MRYVFPRTAALALTSLLVLNLAYAQSSLKELPEGAADDLAKPGDRESHQGADNPMQGNRNDASGRFGGPDPYGAEGYRAFADKAETRLNDPQWQLKIDMQHPKRIVVDQPDGTSKEYWYVLFRVINDNTRLIKDTVLPEPHGDDVDINNPKPPLKVQDNSTGDIEGVPADAHLDFEFHVFTRDIEKDPWDTAWPEDPENEALTPEGLAQRRANMKRVYKPVSNHAVLQRIAAHEGMYEWMGNYDFINEPVMQLHPLSDFQRQIGRAHELNAPDYSGPRCLAYRFVVVSEGEPVEGTRYVAVYGDNTFAGFFGEEDDLPEGATLVKDSSHAMWGKLTIPRYEAGDCIDRFGNKLKVNDPGYLQARIAGGIEGSESSYGVLKSDHPAVGKPVTVPHARLYRAGDRVLKDFDTGRKHADFPNANYRISGKIVAPGDPNYDSAEEIDSEFVGKPVKQIDSRGRAIRRYIVTYQPGDVLTQAEWDIYRRRLGKGILSRYTSTEDIVGRPLSATDPIVGLPKIKLGHFAGEADRRGPESIDRGIDTGRRGPSGEVILEASADYATGRPYSPLQIGPGDFTRDPDGEFTTNRVAPLPDNHGLAAGEEYIYAPLGDAGEDAVPVPRFDRYGAWMDYEHELSGARIPVTDEEGNLVRDMQDQILYEKEYEYEYVYMYEYEPINQDDEGFKARHGGDRYRLSRRNVKFAVMSRKNADGTTVVTEQPLLRLIHEEREVSEPVALDLFRHLNEDGDVEYLTLEEFKSRTGSEPPRKPDSQEYAVDMVKVEARKVAQKVVVGVYTEGKQLKPGQTAETEEAAIKRITDAGDKVEEREVITFVDRFRTQAVSADDPAGFRGTGPTPEEYEDPTIEETDNQADFTKMNKTWSRWTVPPPMVYRDAQGEWKVLTRFADKLGPGRRWDDKDAPRFLTRYISEMWGVAIFENVSRDWDYANVYVRGLRDRVSSAGLKKDTVVTSLPSPVDGTTPITKSFFKPRLVSQEWVYRERFERLGDEFENFRDLVRRTRSFWYLDNEGDNAEKELDN